MSGNEFTVNTDPVGPLRVVLVAPPHVGGAPNSYGGPGSVVATLADALTARGHYVTLLGADESESARQPLLAPAERTVSELAGQASRRATHQAKLRHAIETIASTDGVDIVNDHSFAGPINASIYRSLGLPTVLTVHGPVDDDIHQQYRELGDDVGLIAISDRQRELAPDLNWLGRVHNSLRISDWPYRAGKGDYALFLGQYASDKGAHLALEAAHAAGIPLVLASNGDDPPEQTYFNQTVRPLLTDNDHVFGPADAGSKRKLLAGARCLVFPARWEEPFAMLMIEAMACGTPVVALRGGTVSEVVMDCVTGFVCDRPDELPDAIAKAHTLAPAACRQHVATHFAAGQFGWKYDHIYRSVLATEQKNTQTGHPIFGHKARRSRTIERVISTA